MSFTIHIQNIVKYYNKENFQYKHSFNRPLMIDNVKKNFLKWNKRNIQKSRSSNSGRLIQYFYKTNYPDLKN
jgi:hypothetical protein